MLKKKAIQKDIGDYSALEAVKNSEGGQIIIKSLKKDILTGINDLTSKVKTASHIELVAIIAKISERLILLQSLERSTKNKELAVEALLEVEDEDE
jgi:hypothetical protein